MDGLVCLLCRDGFVDLCGCLSVCRFVGLCIWDYRFSVFAFRLFTGFTLWVVFLVVLCL